MALTNFEDKFISLGNLTDFKDGVLKKIADSISASESTLNTTIDDVKATINTLEKKHDDEVTDINEGIEALTEQFELLEEENTTRFGEVDADIAINSSAISSEVARAKDEEAKIQGNVDKKLTLTDSEGNVTSCSLVTEAQIKDLFAPEPLIDPSFVYNTGFLNIRNLDTREGIFYVSQDSNVSNTNYEAVYTIPGGALQPGIEGQFSLTLGETYTFYAVGYIDGVKGNVVSVTFTHVSPN